MGMLKRKVQENFDNNNVMLKQVLDGLDKVDVVIDNMNQPKKSQIKVIKEENKKSFKQKYKGNPVKISKPPPQPVINMFFAFVFSRISNI